ncbi:ABC transporter substrate-binding protein [Rhodococcus hoagii]|uniref:ABC transporter substrate-binding protein n=1 Tax=Rhodococcus hoagii TaxID=43767 RepID=A0AAE3B9R4_RHOHA|nr:ABC transporter substrate-binding protein [Prescottella equi]MBM4541774.1 ABC transporter substrate-binding protein [Prescottella equi]MBM4713937.1 ABC transporter substrate-binding protein [Prescottella equi]NKS10705.1 ABC transporter substrate-binding protein [Prescottella equi]
MAWRSTFGKVTLASAALVLTVAAGACSRPATQSTADSGGGPLRIAVGIDASYAPFFVADQEGMFADEGLDVQLVQFGRGGEAVDALATGQVQVAGSSDTTTIAQLRQNPSLRAMYSYEVSGDYIKVVLRNGVDTAAGIEKMGIVPGLSQISTDKYLEANGITPGAVEMVSATPTDMPALLSRGDIDGYVLWEPWPATALSQGSGHVVAVTGDYDWFYHHWAITTAPWLEQNEDTARKIAKVLAQASERVESDPQTAAAATRKAVNVAEDQTVTAVSEIDFGVENLTDKDVESAQSIVDFYKKIGVLSEQPDLTSAMLLDWYQEDKQ